MIQSITKTIYNNTSIQGIVVGIFLGNFSFLMSRTQLDNLPCRFRGSDSIKAQRGKSILFSYTYRGSIMQSIKENKDKILQQKHSVFIKTLSIAKMKDK